MPFKAPPPKFSVIVTCYNYERFVSRAIESVAAQTYSNFECIIVDDCSKDGSIEKIQNSLAKMQDGRFRLLSLTQNVGQTEAGIQGLSQATGEFVAFLDADDWWTPDFIALHVAAHLNDTINVGISCCDMMMINADDQLLAGTIMTLQKGRSIDRLKPLANIAPAELFQEEQLLERVRRTKFYYFQHRFSAHWSFAPMSAMAFRRNLINNLLPAPDLRGGKRIKNIDYIYAMIASCLTGWIAIDSASCAYRLHSTNIMSSNPLMGGKYWMSGSWNVHDAMRMHRHNEATIIKNYNALKAAYGHWLIMLALLRLGSLSPLRTLALTFRLTFKYLLTEKRSAKQG